MKQKYYSIWYLVADSWTNRKYHGSPQDRKNPFRLSLGEAQDWFEETINGFFGDNSDFEIREVLPDNSSAPVKKDKLSLNIENLSNDHLDELAFFARVDPGHCPCNIPKQVCRFHN